MSTHSKDSLFQAVHGTLSSGIVLLKRIITRLITIWSALIRRTIPLSFPLLERRGDSPVSNAHRTGVRCVCCYNALHPLLILDQHKACLAFRPLTHLHEAELLIEMMVARRVQR